ncbi:HipA domain-containing protein [Bradyrhizobium sp.]|jgi:HipA-like C-terminal domain|uniref:HipA domain-containing protein n=1 Tax=Bradyrhizobium sp. TaxID=376 RepID=UPI0039C8ABDF
MNGVAPREIKHVYSLMAKAAGIDMPDTRLLFTEADTYFAVSRFDRAGDGLRGHVHTVSGLVHADHRTAGAVEYGDLLKVTWNLTKTSATSSRCSGAWPSDEAAGAGAPPSTPSRSRQSSASRTHLRTPASPGRCTHHAGISRRRVRPQKRGVGW